MLALVAAGVGITRLAASARSLLGLSAIAIASALFALATGHATATNLDFPRAVDGINDASAHIQATGANCPKTKIVLLGGYSQGAAVAGFVTSAVVPPGAVAYDGTGPMPPVIADHLAAVTLFGKPKDGFMGMISQPAIVIGPLYADKTLDSCVPRDPICSDGGDGSLHRQYISSGLVDAAADFAVGKLAPAVSSTVRGK